MLFRSVTSEQCAASPVWKILFDDTQEMERTILQASLSNKLQSIPRMLEGLV